jgi:H+-translocating NAD(P) transhydrogenase subunit beta
VVGGFLITDRMLKMFNTRQEANDRRNRSLLGLVLMGLAAIGVVLVALFLWIKHSTGLSTREVLSVLYLVSAVLFILGLKGLSSPRYARQGMFLAEFGMVVAVGATLFHDDIKAASYVWIVLSLALGSIIGGCMGLRIPMTAVPQRTALSHSLGSLAATLVGIAEYVRLCEQLGSGAMTPLGFEVLIGGLTFTGGLMAAGKLHGLLPERPVLYRGQKKFNIALLATMILVFLSLLLVPSTGWLFTLMTCLALLFGVLMVLPIGAADMPVVIALLNSYGGLADAAMGFVLMNKVQIITGSLDGTSGFLLALLMCRSMNRSPLNVLFGAFGAVDEEAEQSGAGAKGTVRSISPEELATLLADANSVIIVPGYGMALSQAQHAVSDVAKVLQKRGVDVKYGIHPVAGRMPGHMNVLLAEAGIPYEQLYEMERINPYFAEADVALVIGANDVTNPAAKHDRTSPLYGMPILEVDRAHAVIVFKRSLRPGFAGVENELFYDPKCLMLFGDAKENLNKLLGSLKA